VFRNEWHPNAPEKTSFSHYHRVLRYCYAGLASERRPEKLFLQILKAVWYPYETDNTPTDANDSMETQEGLLYLLKFIIAPDFNITGAELEAAFSCPAKYFYESFLGLQRSIRQYSSSIGFVRGNAIHKGMQYAANEWVRSNDPVEAMKAYHRAIIDVWRDSFEVLLRKRFYRGPNKDLRLPVEVDSLVVDQIAEQLEGISQEKLMNEALLFSPERGMSGRADQIIFRKNKTELWEIKTGSRYFIETDYDPLTGVAHPGGIQAFAYREIMKKVLQQPPDTFVEFFDADAGLAEDNPEIIPLEDHAVIIRRKIGFNDDINDQYFDLLLQTRNIAFAIESGLLSGYDRYKINRFLSRRYMPALGTDFEFLSSNWNRICSYCPSNQLGLCADGRSLFDPDIWLHFPQELYSYWSWYFRQLRFELNDVKRYLHKLATTPIEILVDQGITIAPLQKKAFNRYNYQLVLETSTRIFTRIREGDSVFITPNNLKPGEIFSVEGTVLSLKEQEMIIKTRSPLKKHKEASNIYRVDQVQSIHFSRWQCRSLTDFLFESMKRTGILGRKLSVDELPYTTQLLLGKAKPHIRENVKRPRLLDDLDESKVTAIEQALGLHPGDILLIEGPPGTGKTRLIAQLANELFSENYLLRSEIVDETAYTLPKPVLILTNTHRAADEVILKLAQFENLHPYIVRLESYSKDHPEEVQKFILPQKLAYETHFATSADPEILVDLLKQAKGLFDQAGIIVGTLGSVGSYLLKGIKFQWIIVDEAGQATEPAALGALRHLCPESESTEGFPRIILVGDHKQLPPVVSEETMHYTPDVPLSLLNAGLTKNDTLQTSLFERLFRLWKDKFENVVILDKQYRMNEPICYLVKKAFYDDIAYVPATETISNHTLQDFLQPFEKQEGFPSLYAKYLQTIFASSKPVIFLSTENDDKAREGREDIAVQTESRFNIREAQIIAWLLKEFLLLFPEKDRLKVAKQIGVISPYRRQNNLIYTELRRQKISEDLLAVIRVDTVDRFQGDEREIIILSLTNSNDSYSIGQLHADWRRINVSISRAKAKLIIIGDKKTFITPNDILEETEAKKRFSVIFKTITQLKNDGLAEEIPTEFFPAQTESGGSA
ncbi:MAG: AAA domain-containing protein, partial [Asgard group archaeon]|nr:AAA domain-containing protein [Asgard group archaeon]